MDRATEILAPMRLMVNVVSGKYMLVYEPSPGHVVLLALSLACGVHPN